MKRMSRRAGASMVVLVLGIACSGFLAAPLRATANEAANVPDGETLYLTNCRMCHGTKGTAGTPLAGNKNLADAQHVARTIIIGPGYMTGFGDALNDQEIAAIATFVRTNFGNSFGAVEAEQVADAR